MLTGLCALSLVLMFLPERQARWPGRAARPLLVPLDSPGMAVTVHLRTRLQQLTSPPETERDALVRDLRKQVTDLQQMLSEQRGQIEALAQWRAAVEGFPCRLIRARVVFGEALPARDRRVVDAGWRQGVAPGSLVTTRRIVHEMPVVLPERLVVLGRNYVVGQIGDSAANSATLVLVTDPSFRLSGSLLRLLQPGQERTLYVQDRTGGLVQRTVRHDGQSPGPRIIGERIEVQAQGDGREVICRMVPARHAILPGDILTTGAAAEYLPFGLTIGTVRQVEPDKQAAHFVTVHVEPLADLDALRDVYIVLPYGSTGG